MNKALLILDVAHGADVPGKRSPDGKFQEWMWSRGFCKRLMMEFFNPMHKGFDVIVPYLHSHDEPGLSTRVKVYNNLSRDYEFTFTASMHNNAANNPAKWWNTMAKDGGGIEIWTDKEHNHSDELAEIFMKVIMTLAPNEKYRLNHPKDVSKDANFTVIHGYKKKDIFIPRKYEAFLLETLFMDNVVDIKKLMDEKWNTEWVKVVGMGLLEIFKFKGYAN